MMRRTTLASPGGVELEGWRAYIDAGSLSMAMTAGMLAKMNRDTLADETPTWKLWQAHFHWSLSALSAHIPTSPTPLAASAHIRVQVRTRAHRAAPLKAAIVVACLAICQHLGRGGR